MSNYGQLQIASTTFSPCATEGANSFLGRVSESHFRKNDQVIDTPVAVEVYRQSVCVAVAILQRPTMFILTCQLRTMHCAALAHEPYERTVKQLRLWECASAWGQCGWIATGGCDAPAAWWSPAGDAPFWSAGAPPPAANRFVANRGLVRSRRLRPAILLPPRRVFRQTRQQSGGYGATAFSRSLSNLAVGFFLPAGSGNWARAPSARCCCHSR